MIIIWSPTGQEMSVKHSITLTGKDAMNLPKSDAFIYKAPVYSREIQIQPKSIKFSNIGRYITIESKRMKHKIDETMVHERFNSFKFGESTFLYILETLASIEDKFKTVTDLFLYKKEDNSPLSVNPKYNKLAWVVRSWGRTTSYLSFTPHVLADRDSNYIGLKLTSNEGFIGELSWDQFLLLKLSLEGLIRNFYQASLELYNMALNNIILKQISKNSKE